MCIYDNRQKTEPDACGINCNNLAAKDQLSHYLISGILLQSRLHAFHIIICAVNTVPVVRDGCRIDSRTD